MTLSLDLQDAADLEASCEEPREDVLSRERFERRTDRAIRNGGYGQSDGALAISERCIEPLTAAFAAAVETLPARTHPAFEVVHRVREVDPDLLALATLQAVFHGIGTNRTLAQIFSRIGYSIYSELWAKAFKAYDRKTADAVERGVRRKHASTEYRRRAARAAAAKAGFTLEPFTNRFAVEVGAWALDAVLTACPDIFVVEDHQGDASRIALTEDAEATAHRAIDAVIRRYPVYLPSEEPPEPWTGWSEGGPVQGRSRGTLLRSFRKELPRQVTEAIESGQMAPTLGALNAIQATAWTINHRVLGVLRACVTQGIHVPGVPQADPVPKPPQPAPWEEMTALERKQWRVKAAQVAKVNRTLVAERLLLTTDLESADQLAALPAFWTPCNLDWRGRVYAMPGFNFQRGDRVRGLFLFANGEPIGVEGLWWLKVHTANCGDFGKVSKASFDDRVRWVDEHMLDIRQIAKDPLDPEALKRWTQADKPFLFLAACFELVAALDEGPDFVTHLPCSWDGSCSGLQHLSAMTRADEGRLVNLVPTPKPQDVYQTVAERTALRVAEDLTKEDLYPTLADGREEKKARKPTSYYARLFIDGVKNWRKLVKRNTMTYSYSSGKFGMTEQHREDTMRPLATKVLLGELEKHPFGDDDGFLAAKYIADHIHTSIEQIVDRPAQAMAFLQRLAQIAAHEGKCLSWVTPAGLPWSNVYRVPQTKQIRVFLTDRGVRRLFKPSVAVGETRTVDKRKAAAAVAPNFVHACDAAHLLLTVNNATAEGITSFALVHDSFGVLASRSSAMHRIIRETFVKMYEEHDVLGEILAATAAQLDPKSVAKLPAPVARGNLNLKDVLNARYAFA